MLKKEQTARNREKLHGNRRESRCGHATWRQKVAPSRVLQASSPATGKEGIEAT